MLPPEQVTAVPLTRNVRPLAKFPHTAPARFALV
jgi:hypothetical protein